MKNSQIYFGILGALLLGIGDWLLGCVEPTAVNGTEWSALVGGYADGYNTLRPVIAMPLGFFGVLLYAPCMWGMGQIFKSENTRKLQSIMMIAGMGGWALLHYLYAAAVFVFAWMSQNISYQAAIDTSNALYKAVMPGMSLWLVFMLFPFWIHFEDMIKGRSYLPRRMVCFHPLVWWALIYFGTILMPHTAFTNGLQTFAMNGAMLVWLFSVLIYKQFKQINIVLDK